MPRGLLGARSIASRFESAKKSTPEDSSNATEVAWTWHEEEGSKRPVLLPTALKNNFADGALIRVKFAEKPDVPFFIRANAEYYSDRLKTGAISITKSILNAVGIPGNDKRARLENAEESAAMLKQMVMVISDVFLSKRDLSHLQLAMMQQRGRLIYCGYGQNFCEHVPKSTIEQLLGMDGKPAFCGSVGVKTDVVFRSSSAHMFLLIEVSADLFQYGLMGLPYWQILLDCLGQCIERVCVASGKRMSHYIRVLLFARRKPTEGSALGRRSPSATRKEFSAYGPPENHQDYYDVIFEGYASAMPSPQELRSRVSQIFLTLLEEEEKYKRDPAAWVQRQASQSQDVEASPWGRMRAGELVESEQGNLLECLNLALNHFDQHHLDRLLKASGQVVVIMTAGCGLIRTRTKELYLLTNRRCIAAGHTSFQLVGVKDPPWHRVPWVQWPGGPTLQDLVVPTQPPEWEGDKRLSPFPSWLSYIPYQEAVFCPCLDNKDWVKAGFLPLLDSPLSGCAVPVPHWSHGICTVEEQPKRAVQELPELSPKSMPSFPGNGPALRSFRISSNQKTWDEIRLPRLRAHLSKSKKVCVCYAPVAYSVNPQRFGQSEGAKLELMYDLVGLRLAALGGTQVAFHDGALFEEPELGKPEQLQPWQVHGSLLPTSLHDLTVQAACGSEWRFQPQPADLTVSRTERFKMDRDKATSYLYEQFFVHLAFAGKSSEWIESRCVFHLQECLDWNFLDHVLAGVYQIPPALPYPVDRGQLADMVPRRDSSTTSFAGDTRDGWQLRGALKQHMLILMPKSSLASSHSEMMKCVLAKLGGGISIGKDPFDAFDEAGTFKKNQDLLLQSLQERQVRVSPVETQSDGMSLPSRSQSRNDFPDKRPQALSGDGMTWSFEVGREDAEVTRVSSGPEELETNIQDEVSVTADSQQLLEEFANVHKAIMKQFESFQAGLKKLCFGRLPQHQFEKENMGIDTSMKHFTVGRAEKTVSVRGAELETSFHQSRDWFGIFYDDVYSPPKSFHMVVEWIACSSIHMVSFLNGLDKLAARHDFKLLRLPIGVLFPQPAPAWVWSSDQETNFDRLPFYPRKRISIPASPLPREQLYARLLQAWLQPPLKFHFIFASPIQDFKAYPIVAEEDAKENTSAKKEVYQRLKGWVLCDQEGLCLATLREECIYFFQNHLQINSCRTRERMQAYVKKAERVSQQFFQVTTEVFDSIEQS